jgi:phosphohistidine phosphatase
MKKIIIMRHAKSDWENSSLSDIERPLNSRGKKEAPLMGKELIKRKLIPEIMISSPAVRAQETARTVAENFDFGSEIIIDEGFYFGTLNTVIQSLKLLPDSCNSVMIFGHNPTWESLVSLLSGKFPEMPTAAVAVLTFPGKFWNDLAESKCSLEALIIPKDI